jgi:hypothetical protein
MLKKHKKELVLETSKTPSGIKPAKMLKDAPFIKVYCPDDDINLLGDSILHPKAISDSNSIQTSFFPWVPHGPAGFEPFPKALFSHIAETRNKI